MRRFRIIFARPALRWRPGWVAHRLIMEECERRLALNEAYFRELNEKWRRLDTTTPKRPWLNVICECSSMACKRRLLVTVSEYEAVRGVPTWFFITPGEDEPDYERVVLRDDRYAVVEKLGEAAFVADQTDPRREIASDLSN